MRHAMRHGVGHDPARPRRSLESACSPAGVDEQVLNRRKSDDGGCIRSDVNDTSPGSQNLSAGKDREQLQRGSKLVLDHMEATALGIGVESVRAGSHYHLTLVGLAAIYITAPAHAPLVAPFPR